MVTAESAVSFRRACVDEQSYMSAVGASLELQAVEAGERGQFEADAPRSFSYSAQLVGSGLNHRSGNRGAPPSSEAFWAATAPPTAARMDDFMRLYAYK